MGFHWNRVLSLAAFLAMVGLPRAAHASITVLVGEPFGPFGTMMPLGHVALYLDRACADGPTRLRMCRAEEPQGVAVARYHSMGELDWIASPLLDFLYATDDVREIPAFATPGDVWTLRQAYRRRHLRELVPDGTEGVMAGDGRAAHVTSMPEWWETGGMAYNRRVWGYELQTTEAEDRRFIANLNARANRRLYHLKKTNCADFIAELVNVYFAHAVHNDRVADFGLMTPKQVARCVWEYGRAHPELGFRIYAIPQVPGSLRRSRPVRGGAESGLKTKRYLFTLAVLQPEVPLALTFLYLKHGRWKVGEGAETSLGAEQWAQITAPPGREGAASGSVVSSVR